MSNIIRMKSLRELAVSWFITLHCCISLPAAVVLPDAVGPVVPDGSFRTLPDARETLDPEVNPRGLFNFRFGFACGNQQRWVAFARHHVVFRYHDGFTGRLIYAEAVTTGTP